MASNLKDSFKPLSPENGGEVEHMEFIQSRVSPVQWEEDISNSASVCLKFFPNDNGSCAKQELQTLWEMFTSWLKPEEQTKEQMISQLVLEQFLKTGHSKDIAVKQLWESSGRNLGKLMRGLTDECLKPPVMVHVSMHGQEALFSENMTLKEVIKRFKEQLATASTLENERRILPISEDRLLATGHEDSKDAQKYSWNSSEENGCVTSPVKNEMDSLFIIQTDQFRDCDEGAVSDGFPLDLRICQDISRYQEESQSAASSGDVPVMEVQPGISSSPAQTEDFQKLAINCTCEGHHGRLHRDTNKYKCEECFTSFKYPCNLSVHKKVQRKERSFVCTTCHKGFYTHSDLTVHEIIHKKKKPFKCPTCGRPFSHKTYLLIHERIHIEEKPYTCSKCNSSYRQSSTFHRHQRYCHQSE
ncbi:zinc finger and SCAN domain-containing protein 4-like [Chionomys nivalis]|uniref:zinc finger and SCAN domain-containing protein 4-like n=1 Tax=Chionomys nivalis TaxID=269649 RepID=UPI0025992386|nr:zinc finger and SCAN domain-containing protein 4-like [Chionomys nivalis]